MSRQRASTAACPPERQRSGEVAGHLDQDQRQRVLTAPQQPQHGTLDVRAWQRINKTQKRAPVTVAEPRGEVVSHVALAVGVDLLPAAPIRVSMAMPYERMRCVDDRPLGFEDPVEQIRVL